MKVPEIPKPSSITAGLHIPHKTPIRDIQEEHARARSTRDAAGFIIYSLIGLAIACGYYGCFSTKVNTQHVNDDASLILKHASNTSGAKSGQELLGRLATVSKNALKSA